METISLQNTWNSVLFSIICLPADFSIVNDLTAITIDFPFIVKNESVWNKEQSSWFVWLHCAGAVHSRGMHSRCGRAVRQSFPDTRGRDFSLQFCPVHYLYAICCLKFTPLLYQLKPFTCWLVVIIKVWRSLSWSIFISMFAVHSAQLLSCTHWREAGEIAHQSCRLGLQASLSGLILWEESTWWWKRKIARG